MAFRSAIQGVWQPTSRVRSRRSDDDDKRGVSNPRAGSGTESGKNRGVAHAPDPLSRVTSAGRRVAKNAARSEDDAHLQLAGAPPLACWATQSLLRLVPRCCFDSGISIRAPTTAFCRGPPRGVSSSEKWLPRKRPEKPAGAGGSVPIGVLVGDIPKTSAVNSRIGCRSPSVGLDAFRETTTLGLDPCANLWRRSNLDV